MLWNRAKNIFTKKSSINIDSSPSSSTKEPSRVITKIPLPFLKRLIPIGRLPDSDLQLLKTSISQHMPGDIICSLNDKPDSSPYLVKGKCYVETSNGAGYEVDASTFKALYPLNSNVQSLCTVTAKSDASILHFSLSNINHSNSSRNPLINDEDIPENLKDNEFFNKFCHHFKQDKLIIPSLPDIALKLRAAVQKEIGVIDAVKIINIDPVISSKLIQIVNSPLYRTVNPISNCHDAVTRLGLTATRNLVTSISMKSLYKSKNKAINKRIHTQWRQSIQVSSISHTLANLTHKTNPDEALLAGLIHNIGALPIIIFADSLKSTDYSEQDLNLTINTLQGLLGNIILEKWGFPDNLKEIPKNIDNWYYNEDDELNINDIVLIAKFHSYLGSNQMQKLPPLHTLPAFQKLGDNALTPDMSLQTLHNAKQQISEAISLFGA